MTEAARFKQSDVTRAVRGVIAGGVRIGDVMIDPLGNIVIKVASESHSKKSSSLDFLLVGKNP